MKIKEEKNMKKEEKAAEKALIVEIERKKFLENLDAAKGVLVKGRTVLPILENVLMEVSGDEVILKVTDLETSLTRRFQVAGLRVPGKVCVQLKRLFSMIKDSNSEVVRIEEKKGPGLLIKCDGSEFVIPCGDPKEFPEFPDTPEEVKFTKIPRKVISDLIGKVLFASSNEESRYHLNAILLQGIGRSKTIRAVATDGHRLSLIQRRGTMKTERRGVIVPKKGAATVLNLLGRDITGDISIGFSDRFGFFDFGNSFISVRLVDGEFPEWEAAIPKGESIEFEVGIDDLKTAMRTVSRVLTRESGVQITVRESKVEVLGRTDLGEAKESVKIVMGRKVGELPIKIGINPRYVIEALDSFDGDRVFVSIFSLKREDGTVEYGASPLIFRPRDRLQFSLIMPMRVD